MRRALLFAFLLFACDDLNKPMAHPQSEPRKKCFTDVECPSNLKCSKGPQDIEGLCIPRTAVDADAGAPSKDTDAAAPSPAPTITPQPGDIQI